jgi:hypothetical protein
MQGMGLGPVDGADLREATRAISRGEHGAAIGIAYRSPPRGEDCRSVALVLILAPKIPHKVAFSS